jgi:hypothetical protein
MAEMASNRGRSGTFHIARAGHQVTRIELVNGLGTVIDGPTGDAARDYMYRPSSAGS